MDFILNHNCYVDGIPTRMEYKNEVVRSENGTLGRKKHLLTKPQTAQKLLLKNHS